MPSPSLPGLTGLLPILSLVAEFLFFCELLETGLRHIHRCAPKAPKEALGQNGYIIAEPPFIGREKP